jgi:alpha-N-arabinofuranosidase
VRDGAIAMKQADPNVLVTCSGAHGLKAQIDPYLFETAGEYLDLLSIHAYWIENFKKHRTPDYLSSMLLSEKPDAHFNAVTQSLERAGVRGRITIAFDEWNLRSWHHPSFSGHQAKKVDFQDPKIISLIKDREKSLDPTLYTMADALFCASFFNACFRNSDDTSMANIACLVNQTGPLFVHPKGIVKRTHFHSMSMYSNLLQSRVATDVQIESDRLRKDDKSVALVDAVATVDESGKKWAVSLMNRHPSGEVACTLRMNDLSIDGIYKATLLTSDSPDAFNSIENPQRVVPKKVDLLFKDGVCILPPHSLTIVDIQ